MAKWDATKNSLFRLLNKWALGCGSVAATSDITHACIRTAHQWGGWLWKCAPSRTLFVFSAHILKWNNADVCVAFFLCFFVANTLKLCIQECLVCPVQPGKGGCCSTWMRWPFCACNSNLIPYFLNYIVHRIIWRNINEQVYFNTQLRSLPKSY